uniref:Uncharacterized protein n=1 Tax=Glossina palpalis gambiensis TaxID=67801 RepID=A0A1B0BLE7_9MUSC
MGSSLENFPESENQREKRSSLEDTEHPFSEEAKTFEISRTIKYGIGKQLNGDMEVPKVNVTTIQIGSSRRQAPISGATFASLRRVNCLAFTRNSLRIFSVAPGLKVATAAKFVLK